MITITAILIVWLNSSLSLRLRQQSQRLSFSLSCMETFLVVDMGSSSIRCTGYSVDDNKILDYSRVQIKQQLLNDIGRTKADTIFTLVNQAIDKCLENIRSKHEFHVKSVGFSCFAMSFVGCNQKFETVTDTFTYASRLSSYDFKPDEQQIISHFAKTGTILKHPSYAPPHLLSLARSSNLKSIDKFYTLSSLIISRWRNKLTPISYSEASWTGLFDFKHLCWDEHALELCHIPACLLPPVADFDDEPYIPMLPLYAERWPELAEAKIFLGIGDGAAATIGSRCTVVERVSVTIGAIS